MNQTSYSQLVSTQSPLTYVINSLVANAVLSAEGTMQNQLSRLEDENRTLQRKLHNKTTENGKLLQRIEKIEVELQTYRQLLEQINLSANNGQSASCEFAL